MRDRPLQCAVLALTCFGMFLAPPCGAGSAVSYSGKVPDADGIQRDVRFTGAIDGAMVKGVARVGGRSMVVDGVFATDGSVHARVTSDGGADLGVVDVTTSALSASPGAGQSQQFDVSYVLDGRKGSLKLPIDSQITVAPQPASQ